MSNLMVTKDTQIKIMCVCFPEELAEMKNKEYWEQMGPVVFFEDVVRQ